jgi:hypothetical protein
MYIRELLLPEGNIAMLTTDRRHTTIAAEPLPIWMAALVARGCEAMVNGAARRIEWRCVSGRAVYTNAGPDTEMLLPFGIPVAGGDSVVVSWLPGDTSYTVELDRPDRLAA